MGTFVDSDSYNARQEIYTSQSLDFTGLKTGNISISTIRTEQNCEDVRYGKKHP